MNKLLRRAASVALLGLALPILASEPRAADPAPPAVKPDEVLGGLKSFYAKTARDDGSYRPGIDPTYEGMSDSAASDMAPVAYAVILHKTFGWELADEKKTL